MLIPSTSRIGPMRSRFQAARPLFFLGSTQSSMLGNRRRLAQNQVRHRSQCEVLDTHELPLNFAKDIAHIKRAGAHIRAHAYNSAYPRQPLLKCKIVHGGILNFNGDKTVNFIIRLLCICYVCPKCNHSHHFYCYCKLFFINFVRPRLAVQDILLTKLVLNKSN